MPRAPGGGNGTGFRPLAVLVGLAFSLALFGVIASFMGLLYGLWASVTYPPWTYMAVHGLSLLAGAGWAGSRGASAGWLHGLAVGLLYVAAALWLLPHDDGIGLAQAGRALAVTLPLGILGGALGRNVKGASG